MTTYIDDMMSYVEREHESLVYLVGTGEVQSSSSGHGRNQEDGDFRILVKPVDRWHP